MNTILTDDPQLNARHAHVPTHPFRYVLDRDLRTPPSARVLTEDGGSTTIYCRHDTSGPFRRRWDALEAAGASIAPVPIGADGNLDLAAILNRMRGLWVRYLLVEPGPTLASSLFQSRLVDRLWLFRSERKLLESDAPVAMSVPPEFVKTGELNVDGDTLTEYLNPQSDVFFAPEASADFVLARDATTTSSRP